MIAADLPSAVLVVGLVVSHSPPTREGTGDLRFRHQPHWLRQDLNG